MQVAIYNEKYEGGWGWVYLAFHGESNQNG